ncbi:hypothetical protein Hanom_Chr09g00803831 [Helianthus anomalus]
MGFDVGAGDRGCFFLLLLQVRVKERECGSLDGFVGLIVAVGLDTENTHEHDEEDVWTNHKHHH